MSNTGSGSSVMCTIAWNATSKSARLRMAGNPIGWFLSQVWDRFRERPLWSSQQAVKNAREMALLP